MSPLIEKKYIHDKNADDERPWIRIKEESLKSSPPLHKYCGETLNLKSKTLVEELYIPTKHSLNNDKGNHIGDEGGEMKTTNQNELIKFNSKGTVLAIEDKPILSWVRLSHIGHISDYHGYKRRYEHFAPLQFGPIDDIKKQIERTLVENMKGNNEESDEEVIQENEDYEKAIKQHEVFAQKERSIQAKVKNHRNLGVPKESKECSQDNMLIKFSSRTIDTMCSIDLTKKTHNELFEIVFRKSGLQPPVKFRYFDEENDILFNVDEGNKNGNHKRRSRSAHIAAQKRTSIRILNEMLHSLYFIEKYNRKSKDDNHIENKKRKGVVDIEVINDDEKESNNDFNQKCEDTSSSKKSKRMVKGSGHKVFGKIKPPVKFEPLFVPLTPTTHLENYKVLQTRYLSFYPLEAKGDLEEAKEEIQSILNEDILLDEFLEEKDIVSEEKDLARCIRGYSMKADQEKIEKKNFEEEQKLRQHEFQYYRKRKKKRSPEEVEWKDMFTRRIRYVGCGASLPKSIENCKYKPNCSICDPILKDKCRDDTIYFPGFRRVKEDVYIPSDFCLNNESTGRSKSAYMHRLKLASSLKLLELYHTFVFIQDYNKGMIVSRKKKRR